MRDKIHVIIKKLLRFGASCFRKIIDVLGNIKDNYDKYEKYDKKRKNPQELFNYIDIDGS